MGSKTPVGFIIIFFFPPLSKVMQIVQMECKFVQKYLTFQKADVLSYLLEHHRAYLCMQIKNIQKIFLFGGMLRPFSMSAPQLFPLHGPQCFHNTNSQGWDYFDTNIKESRSDRKHRAREVNWWPRGQKACKLIEPSASPKLDSTVGWHVESLVHNCLINKPDHSTRTHSNQTVCGK